MVFLWLSGSCPLIYLLTLTKFLIRCFFFLILPSALWALTCPRYLSLLFIAKISTVFLWSQPTFSLPTLLALELPHLSYALSMVFPTFVSRTTPQVFYSICDEIAFACNHAGWQISHSSPIFFVSNVIFRSLHTLISFWKASYTIPLNFLISLCPLLLLLFYVPRPMRDGFPPFPILCSSFVFSLSLLIPLLTTIYTSSLVLFSAYFVYLDFNISC